MAMLQTRHAPAADALALAPGDRPGARPGARGGRTGARRLRAPRRRPARRPRALAAAAWAGERPLGDGIRAFLDPARLVFAPARKPAEALWAAEEALRTGRGAAGGGRPRRAAGADRRPPAAPRRRGRRLRGGAAPLALLLTPGSGGAPGIETRWHLAPAPGWARRLRPALAAHPRPRPHGAGADLGGVARGRAPRSSRPAA